MPENGPFCPIFYFREPHFAHFLRKFVRIFSTCRPIPLLSMLIHSCFKLENFIFSNLLTLCKFMVKYRTLLPMVLHCLLQGFGFPGVTSIEASCFINIEIYNYALQPHNPKYVLDSFDALTNILLLNKLTRPTCPS